MTNNILNEKKSELLKKLIANWVSYTRQKPSTAGNLARYLKSDRVRSELPLDDEVIDNAINKAYYDQESASFGSDDDRSSSRKPANTAAYTKRLQKVIDELNDSQKEALLRKLNDVR